MRLASVAALIVIGAGAGGCGCGGTRRAEAPLKNEAGPSGAASEDNRLVARIRAAVAAGVPAYRLARHVGRAPIVDTTAGATLAMLQHVSFATEPAHPSERFDPTSRVVVYWRRPVAGDDPRVVGVQVAEDDVARVFFAIILPP